MNEKPLVSAKVLTYNSSNYIIEALESIKNQSYSNLELIISDDCSQDDTVMVCKKWVKENGKRFKRVVILESEKNTGISANNNRAYKECQGEWTKGIAADDLMLPDCIATYMDSVVHHPDINMFFGRLRPFTEKDGLKETKEAVPKTGEENYFQEFNKCSAYEQFRKLLRDGCFLQAPTGFFRTSFMIKHPYTELYKYQEDYPMWLKLTRQGFKMHVLFKETVLYRIGESLSHRSNDYYSRNYMSTRSLFFWNECLNYYKQENMLEAYNKYRKILLKYELTEAFTQNKRSKFNSLKVRIMYFIVNKYAKYEL